MKLVVYAASDSLFQLRLGAALPSLPACSEVLQPNYLPRSPQLAFLTMSVVVEGAAAGEEQLQEQAAAAAAAAGGGGGDAGAAALASCQPDCRKTLEF